MNKKPRIHPNTIEKVKDRASIWDFIEDKSAFACPAGGNRYCKNYVLPDGSFHELIIHSDGSFQIPKLKLRGNALVFLAKVKGLGLDEAIAHAAEYYNIPVEFLSEEEAESLLQQKGVTGDREDSSLSEASEALASLSGLFECKEDSLFVVQITTPFILPDGTAIEMYAQKLDGEWVIFDRQDLAFTLSAWHLTGGVEFIEQPRQQLTLSQYRVFSQNGMLIRSGVSKEKFSEAIVDMVQASLAIVFAYRYEKSGEGVVWT